jgi:uncharacterized protein
VGYKLKFALLLSAALLPAAEPTITWQGWSDKLFDQAKAENKFVILDLEAVWCHWCHVMAETTYKDPEVVRLMQAKYIAVRVDQDARPDLSNRYEDYGWPATIVFGANGKEIIMRSGYIPPEEFRSVLKAIITDPTPGPSVPRETKMQFGTQSRLTAAQRAQLEKMYVEAYDTKHGAWGHVQKFLDWNAAEYALARAKAGDMNEKMARQSLTAQLHLVDPVWGGVYQYSTGGDWNEPHFEKIMSMQANDLRIYALGYAQYHDAAWLKAATDIHRFLTTFLRSPEGAFYTSQDADLVDGEHSGEYFKLGDAERRKQGIPRVDKHEYARENGWAIQAVATLYAATGDEKYLQDAVRAAQWVMENRALTGGGFRHDAVDVAGPYLADTLAMGQAFLQLYEATGDRAWLGHANDSADFLMANFRSTVAGYVTTKTSTDQAYTPRQERDENILIARFLNLLAAYSGNKSYREGADHAMRYLATPQVAAQRPTGGVLLADLECAQPAVHITVTGPKNDPAARALFQAANALPGGYKRIEWLDASEGPLPNADVEFPQRKEASAYICTGNSCSSPIIKPEEIRPRLERLAARQ